MINTKIIQQKKIALSPFDRAFIRPPTPSAKIKNRNAMETTPIRFSQRCVLHGSVWPIICHPITSTGFYLSILSQLRVQSTPILVIDLGEELAAPFVRCRRRFRASKTIFQSRTWAFLNLLPLVTGMGYSEIFRGLSLKRWYESSNPN
jgi:hypothetical protein